MDGLGLKLARVRAGLTLWEVGQLVGLNAARISEMGRCQRPITEAVFKAINKEQEEYVGVGA